MYFGTLIQQSVSNQKYRNPHTFYMTKHWYIRPTYPQAESKRSLNDTFFFKYKENYFGGILFFKIVQQLNKNLDPAQKSILDGQNWPPTQIALLWPASMLMKDEGDQCQNQGSAAGVTSNPILLPTRPISPDLLKQFDVPTKWPLNQHDQ